MEKDDNKILVFNDLKIDLRCRKIQKGLDGIELRRKEFDILVLLTEHPGWGYTKEQIYNAVWKGLFPILKNEIISQKKILNWFKSQGLFSDRNKGMSEFK